MGLMPAGASNPFSSVSQQAALGLFKASGSRDRDVLFAQKETMLAPYQNLKKLAIICYVIGGLFTIMVFMAWFGIPVLIGAWLLWRFQAKQVANVEAAYSEYLATVNVS
jgi:hypothetical protein